MTGLISNRLVIPLFFAAVMIDGVGLRSAAGAEDFQPSGSEQAVARVAQNGWFSTTKKKDETPDSGAAGGGSKETRTAQDANTKPATTGGATAPNAGLAWAVSCNDRRGQFVCEMTQQLIEKKSRRQILLVSIKAVKDGTANAMLFRLPHGVYLPAGISVAVDDGKSKKLEFQKSDRFGVYAALPLDDSMVKAMKKGSKLRIRAELNKGKPLELGALLKGFASAYDRIKSPKQ